jgi:hypothetical protein
LGENELQFLLEKDHDANEKQSTDEDPDECGENRRSYSATVDGIN